MNGKPEFLPEELIVLERMPQCPTGLHQQRQLAPALGATRRRSPPPPLPPQAIVREEWVPRLWRGRVGPSAEEADRLRDLCRQVTANR